MTVKTSFMCDIRFPVRADRSFCHGQGQNGRVLMTGLTLSAYAGHPFVMLNPITSRGVVSKSAGFEIAHDKATLTALADLVHRFSKSAETYADERAASQPHSIPALRLSDVWFPPVVDKGPWPLARGRNKRSFVSGLQVSIGVDLDVVTIRPYNSRSKLAPYCWLEVAFDPKTLQELADAFLTLAKDAP